MKPGLFQIMIIGLIILVLFGRGRISEMMGDCGKGIKCFQRGLGEEEAAPARIETAELSAEPAADKTAG